jgi:hypothetical protein
VVFWIQIQDSAVYHPRHEISGVVDVEAKWTESALVIGPSEIAAVMSELDGEGLKTWW